MADPTRMFPMPGDKSPVLPPESPSPERLPEANAAEGDFRGPYGYGRPAHRPEPNATYIFRPDVLRVLPVRRKSRWR